MRLGNTKEQRTAVNDVGARGETAVVRLVGRAELGGALRSSKHIVVGALRHIQWRASRRTCSDAIVPKL